MQNCDCCCSLSFVAAVGNTVSVVSVVDAGSDAVSVGVAILSPSSVAGISVVASVVLLDVVSAAVVVAVAVAVAVAAKVPTSSPSSSQSPTIVVDCV